MIDVLLAALAGFTTLLALFFGYRLYQWEKLLSRSRVKVYFKNKPAMTPRLIDIVQWSGQLSRDKAVNGQVIYKQGGTTIALTKAHKRVPKAKAKTVKETKPWQQKRADSQHGSQPVKEGRWKAKLGVKETPR